MTIYQRLQLASREALKNKDSFSRQTISYIISVIDVKKKSIQRDLEDNEVIDILFSIKKKYQETLSFKEDENTKKELNILELFLPESMDLAEVNLILDKIFSELNPQSIKDMGKVMQEATKKIVYDKSKLSNLIKNKLL